MTDEIYGIDPEGKVTPLMVRDAIIECFYEAHCADAAFEGGEKEVNRNYCQEIVKKAFTDTGGDFEKPTKESIGGVLGQLAEFAKNFRDPKVIEKNYGEIKILVDRLE